ncbi:uncharacterized protein LOC116846178 [Odontomachus brunneus]|uniref:uncharacterized protein LOC116846178 n=1 Tax=Odontomachus brunneus TaxID=486640 RepID=UPI0013F27165|nr:uncharacterized protein LOC116846178 [Odontomachus brunneus]
MSVTFKRFILNENNEVIQDMNNILYEVENEAGLNIIMMDKKQLLEAGYEIPDNFNLYEKRTEESPNINDKLDAHTVQNVDEWTEESTRFILNKYSEYLQSVGPMKKFKNKKIMWIEISKNVETVLGIYKTYIQCENRYKTIMRRKRLCDKNNSTSGSKRVKVSFENELKQIAAKDDSIEPEILQSASNVVFNVKNTNLSEASKTVKKKKSKSSLLETLIEMHKEKESKRQERHEEKMSLLKSFLEKENVHKDS